MPGISDIPSGFGFHLFIRIFLSGLIGTILFSIAVIPLWHTKWYDTSFSVDNLVFYLLAGTLFGIILTLFDFYIYQFYEGLKFWPNGLLKIKYDHMIADFEKTVELYWEQNKDTLSISELSEKSNILYKLREYPYCPEMGYPEGRYPTRATRLGNVMAEYESYSEKQYGMHMLVFWNQLWFLSPNDVRSHLDIKSAMADFCIYTSFIFLLYALLAPWGFSFQISRYMGYNSLELIISQLLFILILAILTYFFKSKKIGLRALYGRRKIIFLVFLIFILPFILFFMLYILNLCDQVVVKSQIFGVNLVYIYILLYVETLISSLSLILSYVFYCCAVNALINFGRNVKAFFDVYRFNLADKFGLEMSLVPDEDEKNRWANLGNFLLQYRR